MTAPGDILQETITYELGFMHQKTIRKAVPPTPASTTSSTTTEKPTSPDAETTIKSEPVDVLAVSNQSGTSGAIPKTRRVNHRPLPTSTPTHSAATTRPQPRKSKNVFPPTKKRICNHHIVKTKFVDNFHLTHQKGRRIPLAIQPQVEQEINRLLKEGHIEKLNSCTDDQFISPIVITVKRDKSVKLALDSRELNKNIHKNKYQMPNIDKLMDNVSQIISAKDYENQDVWFTMLDLTYAYGQLLLDVLTSLQCNFYNATGTYRFKTGFYGLADMPAEFQQALDMLVHDLPFTHAFIDDILIVTTGSKSDHLKAIDVVLSRLDNANMALKLSKCTFLAREADWLGYHIDSEGISPLPHKTDAIMKLDPPKTPKQLKSLLGAVNQMSRFVPHLAQNCDTLRDLLKKKNKFQWSLEHTQAFTAIKNSISNLHKTAHFDVRKESRIKCDASRTGLGACLEQRHPDGWKPIAFRSRFLNEAEQKYSTNELELLAIVWSTEQFRNYIHGRPFEVITDHQALLSALPPNRGNKTFFSRLTRWVDKLLPYNFVVNHQSGEKIGLADYLSRHPTSAPDPVTEYDEEFVIARVAFATKLLFGCENTHVIPRICSNIPRSFRSQTPPPFCTSQL